MKELCRRDLCSRCEKRNNGCEGCAETQGHPCGGSCVAADIIKNKGFEAMPGEIEKLCFEINSLGVEGLTVNSLNLLSGDFVNLIYPLPNGKQIDFLDNQKVYWGNQIEIPGKEKCLGVVADESFILICEYSAMGENPEILFYKKRV